MTRILVAIDGSKPSHRALRYLAERKARGETFEAFIVTVLPKILPDRYASKRFIDAVIKRDTTAIMGNAVVKALVKDLGAHTKVLTGDPSEEIAAYARRARCREIVMGTRGLGALGGMILGSVATKVLHRTNVPVTLVR